MKIAILSDIHGNDIALEAVLTDAEQSGAERLFILGDLVGYYYRPLRVLELLSAWNCDMIQGNHERLLKSAMNSYDDALGIKQKYGSGIQIAIEQIKPDKLVELLALPLQKSIIIDGIQFELCHGSPRNPDEYIYPDSPTEVLDRCMIADADMIFMGHTHYPFINARHNALLVNAGSVGQARDRGGIASWAIVNTANASLTLKSTPYDPTSLIEESKSRDPLLPYLHEILTRNSTTKM